MKFKKKGWVFAQIPIWAACDPNISDSALRLFVYLAWRQGNNSSCWPSLSRMARDLQSSQKTIQRRLRELEEAGYLVTRHRPGRSNEYTLVADPDGASAKHMPTAPQEETQVKSVRGTPPKLTGTPVKSDQGPRSNLSGTPVKSVPHDDKKEREKEDGEKQDDATQPLWTRTLEELQLQTTRPVFETWLRTSTARLEGEALVVQLANRRALDWVRHRLDTLVRRTARRVFENPMLSIAYEVR